MQSGMIAELSVHVLVLHKCMGVCFPILADYFFNVTGLS